MSAMSCTVGSVAKAAAAAPSAARASAVSRCIAFSTGPLRAPTAACAPICGRPAHSRRLNRSRAAMGVSCAAGAAPTTQAFTIVGAGRVGEALANMGAGSDVLVGRGGKVDGPPGPIVVCTRNDDLEGVVEATAPERRKDLVFIQNGMLQPWLDARGLGDNTQVLVYFAVAKKGDSPTDGKTDVNPEGLTAATGPHAEAFAARLAAAGLSCKVLDKPEFTKSMLEKLIWISAFMLVGARHGGVTVGDVESQYGGEVSALIAELAAAGEAALGVKLDDGTVARLNAYARSVAHFPTAVKEFPWRNGWFYSLTQAAEAAGQPDPCPTHTAWLKEVGAA